MDTNWFEDFLAVLQEGGFSRAAERRGITQPAFSRRIRALEDWVGAPLFDRATHNVRLTSAGEHFHVLAEEMLRRLNAGRMEVLAAARVEADTLRFASTHALSLTFFPEWLKQLEPARFSASAVQLTADHMVACEQLMIEGRVQFLLCHAHPSAKTRLVPETFQSVVLGRDVLVPVAAPAVAAAAGVLPFLAYTAESGMGRILTAAWADAGREEPRHPVFASHVASVLAALARDGRGMAWSPLSLVGQDLAEGRLVRAGSRAEEIQIDIRLYRSRHRQSIAAEAIWKKVLSCSSPAGSDAAALDENRCGQPDTSPRATS